VSVALVDGPIDVPSVIAAVERPSAGAIDVFLGVVRDHDGGRAVSLLEYEAYVPMAIAEMKRIVDELEREMPEVKLAVTHRRGALRVGELAVVCAASSPHRSEAFTACRALIDRIKERVPIWKREHGPEGAYWVGWKDARCH
jgi:molybdopterin synthase catalytic subunit